MTKYVAAAKQTGSNCLQVSSLIIAIIALVLSCAVLGLFLSDSGSGSMAGEQQQLLDKYEALQLRMNRMQKELLFLETRQKTAEAREASEKRRVTFQQPPSQPDGRSDPDLADPDLPMIPSKQGSDWLPEEPIDVDKLPRASPNKKKGNKI